MIIEIFQNKSKTLLQSNQLLHLVNRHCSLIVKDQFGAVGTITLVNWDWETQGTETKQKRFKDFLQSNQWQEDITIHCFLIVKDLSGAVGTIKLVDWDWETQGTETKQNRFKDFLQSNQWQEERIFQCLWTSKAMFGFVDRIRKENWGWATQNKSIRLRKTTIFLELLLLQEGIVIFQCFWTNKEMFSLVGTIIVGSWDWETLQTDTNRRKSTTSLQCLHFLLATQRSIICRLWIVKEECGAVGAMTMGNWVG